MLDIVWIEAESSGGVLETAFAFQAEEPTGNRSRASHAAATVKMYPDRL